MKSKWKALLGVARALALNVAFASAALARGGSEQALGVDRSVLFLPPEYVLGGVALFGILYAGTRVRG